MESRLDSRVALVTGGARGQGAMHVRLLAGEGARVVFVDVLESDGSDIESEVRAAGGEVGFLPLDVSDRNGWAGVVSTAEQRYGPVDILVNNAGVSSRPGVTEIDATEWARVVGINQSGVLWGMQAVAPSMVARGRGSIINVSSMWAHTGGVGSGNIGYVATKCAVLGMTQNAALELGPAGVRVNSISPGYLNHLMSGKPDPTIDAAVARTPLRRAAELSEMSEAVLFLASDESSFITGIDIRVDGGFSLG